MSERYPNLVWLRTFEAAARLLNFTAAGRELGLTQTAVSLHIKALEGTLGYQLFERRPRNLELTAVGQAYVHSIRKALGDINLATTSLFGSVAKQTITVRAPISTASLFLAPLLPDFLREYEDINIRLISTIWADSIADEDIDVDLRLGYGDWPGMQVEKISDEAIVPICAATAFKSIKSMKDLLTGPLVHILGYEDNWDRYLTAFDLSPDSRAIRLSTDTTSSAISFVVAKGGYATVIHRLAEAAIASGIGIKVVGEPITFPQSHYLVAPVRHTSPRAEAEIFKTWLRDRFAG